MHEIRHPLKAWHGRAPAGRKHDRNQNQSPGGTSDHSPFGGAQDLALVRQEEEASRQFHPDIALSAPRDVIVRPDGTIA